MIESTIRRLSFLILSLVFAAGCSEDNKIVDPGPQPQVFTATVAVQVTADAFIPRSTSCEFKVSKHGGQKIIEIMSDAAGHLTDHFHFLSLLERGLNLPPF